MNWLGYKGTFGRYGGRFVAETLVPALEELERATSEILPSTAFGQEYAELLRTYVGRPTPLFDARRLARRIDPSGSSLQSLWLKREDLCHTGAHKINNALGQVLLARRMGKTRVIAETGAGQHGVATATAAALLGLPCDVYQGVVDMLRQAPNVARMELLGARVIGVSAGSGTLVDAMNEALRDWVTNVRTTHYCVGTVAGPHPYPTLVAELQRIIGDEAREQCLARGALPDVVVACVGGGSNAIGMWRAFFDDADVKLVGVEAAGKGLDTSEHAATLHCGRVGVLHGAKTYVLCDEHGQIVPTHSISAGLDYPGVGPEHAALLEARRATYVAATDDAALEAARGVAKIEGLIVALESAHALAALGEIVRGETDLRRRPIRVAVCLSGRGDKDLSALVRSGRC